MRLPLALAALLLAADVAAAQPEAVAPGVTVNRARRGIEGGTNLAADRSTGSLVALTFSGDVLRHTPPFRDRPTTIATLADLAPMTRAYGLDVADDGRVFVVGSAATETANVGVLKRGTPAAGGLAWETVFVTEPYPLARTAFDHNMSAVAVSPDGAWVAVNSGSRTDHGEVQDGGGIYPGVREVPITSAVLRVPADATGLTIPTDADGLAPYLWADGIRNSFALAFDGTGELFGAENSGDRDDGEELNWIREGAHYGFPWRMGANRTPMQDPGYDPDQDPLVQPGSFAYQSGFFYDDPDYPAPPDGVTFTDPILNLGPDADLLRDPDGTIVDASDAGRAASTFTPHRSPVDLEFDQDAALPDGFRGDAFMVSWTDGEPASGSLLAAFGDEGEDLVHLRLSDDRATVETTQLVRGFENPIGLALLGQTLHVLPFTGGGLWLVTLPGSVSAEAAPAAPAVGLALAPNPARGAATAQVTLAESSAVRARVVDALGRAVAELHDGPLAAGTTALAVELRGLAPGVYRVVVESEAGVAARPLSVVR